MSTRASIYYEKDGIHIFTDMADSHDGYFLEYREGSFDIRLPLSPEFSQIINRGLGHKDIYAKRPREKEGTWDMAYIKSNDPIEQEYFDYLEELRQSGDTNMWGAV